MNDTNKLTEVQANLVLGELKRQERLLKIIRGKPEWQYYTGGAIIFLMCLSILCTRKPDHIVPIVLAILVGLIFGAYLDCSRRVNALIELIGEENLRKLQLNHTPARGTDS